MDDGPKGSQGHYRSPADHLQASPYNKTYYIVCCACFTRSWQVRKEGLMSIEAIASKSGGQPDPVKLPGLLQRITMQWISHYDYLRG